jgi:hypothetical protein
MRQVDGDATHDRNRDRLILYIPGSHAGTRTIALCPGSGPGTTGAASPADYLLDANMAARVGIPASRPYGLASAGRRGSAQLRSTSCRCQRTVAAVNGPYSNLMSI